jgi:hypothetical protein
VPVRRVGRSGCADGRDNLGQGIGAIRCPEADRLGRKVDIVGEVVPVAWLQLDGPVCLATRIPAQGVVG